MSTTDFSQISARYDRDSLIQKSAAERLIGLLDVRGDDDVLDLGCGTGSLTRKLRGMTNGRIAGIDPSEGMIREAEAKRDGLDISFSVGSGEDLAYEKAFSAVLCNSTFQWFREPDNAVRNCHRALKTSGRMGIQAPAKRAYCPNFLEAVDAVAHDPRTTRAYAQFRSPWIFFDTAEEYAALFRHAHFAVPFVKIETITTFHTPEEVMTIFESGAAAGYLNQEYYATSIDDAFAEAFREIVRKSVRQQANKDGKVEVVFNRIYLLAVK
jgi:ubiquinone/menaquinone biosynthesis C-methylase UbiE